jgi:hypothetical protein
MYRSLLIFLTLTIIALLPVLAWAGTTTPP